MRCHVAALAMHVHESGEESFGSSTEERRVFVRLLSSYRKQSFSRIGDCPFLSAVTFQTSLHPHLVCHVNHMLVTGSY